MGRPGFTRGRGAAEELGLADHAHLVPGTIVVIDLDCFGEVVRERGWSEYEPNPATGLLTHLVEELVRRFQGVVVYGLDWERGTEEVVLEFPLTEPEELKPHLEAILEELRREAGVTATIVAVRGMVGLKPSGSQRDARRGTPWREEAWRLLRRAKRRGGGVVIVV